MPTAVTQEISRAYEVVFILKPSLADEDVASELEKVKGAITQKAGEVVSVENRGKKKLAYEIQKEKRGVFIFVRFKGSQKSISDLQRIWRLQETIMRFMLVKIKLGDLQPKEGTSPVGTNPDQTEDITSHG